MAALLALSNALPVTEDLTRQVFARNEIITCNNGAPADVVAADLTELVNALRDPGAAASSGVTIVGTSIDLPSGFQAPEFRQPVGSHKSVGFAVIGQALFTHTHLPYMNIAQAIQIYQEQCCDVFPMCVGGSVDKVRGDTSQPLQIVIGNSGNCKELQNRDNDANSFVHDNR